MKNETNKRKYRVLSYFYDQVMRNRWFEQARKREFELAQIQPYHRSLNEMLKQVDLEKRFEEPAIMGSFYKIVQLTPTTKIL